MPRSKAPDTEKEVISYAQNWEDLILHVLLHGIENGFYVDVGANEPIVDSVTYYFYLRGWRGVNIEPNPTHIESLKRHRPHDVNLQVAVSNMEGTGQFREYLEGGHGLSTLSSSMKKEHEHEPLKFRDYTVQILPLRKILQEHIKPHRSIDFLKIDVEGLEYEVLEGNDWHAFRPKVIVVEANHIKKDWKSLLVEQGYQKVFFDGLNEYYAENEYAAAINFDVYPQVVTERGPLVSLQQKLRQDKLVDHYKQNIQNLDLRLSAEEDKVNDYRARLNWVNEHPIRFMLGNLYHQVVKRSDVAQQKHIL